MGKRPRTANARQGRRNEGWERPKRGKSEAGTQLSITTGFVSVAQRVRRQTCCLAGSPSGRCVTAKTGQTTVGWHPCASVTKQYNLGLASLSESNGFGQLWTRCPEQGSAPEPYAHVEFGTTFTLIIIIIIIIIKRLLSSCQSHLVAKYIESHEILKYTIQKLHTWSYTYIHSLV